MVKIHILFWRNLAHRGALASGNRVFCKMRPPINLQGSVG